MICAADCGTNARETGLLLVGRYQLVLAVLFDHIDVVDQARRAECRRAQDDQQIGMVEALGVRNAQADPVANRDVIDSPSVARKIRPSGRLEVGVIGPAAGDVIGDFAQRSIQPWRFRPLDRRQVVVPL